MAKELQLEGIIAKRKGSFYVPSRRTSAWVKYKLNQCHEFVIGGYTPGNPFDALIVGYYDGSKLNFVAKGQSWFRASRPPRGFSTAQRFRNRQVSLCESAGKAPNLVGLNGGRDEKLPMAEA